MKLKNNSQEFYTNFKENLTKSQKWPGIHCSRYNAQKVVEKNSSKHRSNPWLKNFKN